MKFGYTTIAIIDTAQIGGHWAICLEIPGVNGQAETIVEANEILRQAIVLMLEDHRADNSSA